MLEKGDWREINFPYEGSGVRLRQEELQIDNINFPHEGSGELCGLLSEEATYNAPDGKLNESLSLARDAEERLRQRRGNGRWIEN